jgi:hypothetical protein
MVGRKVSFHTVHEWTCGISEMGTGSERCKQSIEEHVEANGKSNGSVSQEDVDVLTPITVSSTPLLNVHHDFIRADPKTSGPDMTEDSTLPSSIIGHCTFRSSLIGPTHNHKGLESRCGLSIPWRCQDVIR